MSPDELYILCLYVAHEVTVEECVLDTIVFPIHLSKMDLTDQKLKKKPQ